MKKFNTIFFFFVLYHSAVYSQYSYNWIRIQHPQETWRNGQGTIEQAVVSVKPKGGFFQCDLYLTISARGLSFSSSDSVEIQMDFGLPAEAIVNDLWLWMDNNSIMRGLILDRWTASNIYENIVKRRKDPALLMKNSSVQYSLRIYPMKGTASRKVKISYILPARMETASASIELPTGILRTSLNQLPKVTLLFWPTPKLQKAHFHEFAGGFEATPRFDTLTEKSYYYGEIPGASLSGAATLSAESQGIDSIVVSKFDHPAIPGTGYFHVAFNPAKVFGISTGQKVVFLFEFNESKSAYSSLNLINSFKSFIRSNFTSKDSFNLIFSGTQVKRIKQSGWFGGDTASIEDAFDLVSLNAILDANNLLGLITDGIDFIRTNGNNGVLWLIAGSDAYHTYTVANPAINSLTSLLKPVVPISITDVSGWSVASSYFNNRYYYGNEYFYENLSRMTGGTLASYRQNSSLQTNLSMVLDQIRGTIQSFDMITRIDDGFCSNRYTINGSSAGSDLPIDRTISQIGRYNGSFPFLVEVAGIFRGQTLSKKISVSADEMIVVDSTLETAWIGNYIAALEAQPQTNGNTKLIIDASVAGRVLSRYTAFLALEPNDTLKACITCRDETKLVHVDGGREPLIPTDDSLIFAYPNPFNPETKLKVRLPRGIQNTNVTLQIFNVLGQLVKTFDVGNLSDKKFYELRWDGRSDDGKKVSSGVYFAVLTTPQKRHTFKLMMMK